MTSTNKKTKTSTYVAIGIIVVVVGFIIFKLIGNKQVINERAEAVPQGVEAMPVKVATVTEKELNSAITLPGSFEARKSLPLVAEAQGSIIQLNIAEGQQVRRGQVVARIDPTAIQSNLATARASYNNAVKNKERYERLVQAGAISQKQYEDVALNVENARANLTGIEQQMKYAVVYAPMSGIVGEVKVEQGSFATTGMQLGNVIDISKLKMVLKVPEEDVIKVKEGQPVKIITEVYPNHTFTGNITLISVQADAGRKYDVEVEVDNTSQFPLKAGMFGTAMLNAQTGEDNTRLFVPRRALVGSVKDAKVFVLQKDNTVALQAIEVQNVSGEDVIVLGGLSPQEKVIISGQINLQPGDKVRVTE
ncbi:efflux RND transporter periplasmic adaptor subunit [Pontibacter sp. E15-1]|uniref:efflux RND transporter periplasmic adaptor subunit n=1 Tax=Pontibacter sp. E15-1 TaxID=2919918 RepID=UPI001F4F8A49|nr:efflux RND transporter periplasmic adaptor subunit [Pontibacter sp. E15-1]MCJ8163450.1 efflux RND transporter periplasmic adaptor subunit [Pontibacter sp. E15-1]